MLGTIKKQKRGTLRELEYERYILSTHPVLWLPLYRSGGSVIKSADGFGHICTVTGATWGKYGRTFDGDDDNIDCGNASSLQISGDFTVEIWIYISTLPSVLTHNENVVKKQGNSANTGYYLYLEKANDKAYMVAFNGTTLKEGYSGVLTVGLHHLVGIVSGTTVSIYDNLVKGTDGVNLTGGLVADTGNNLTIGTASNSVSGIVGEVREYSRALSLGGITANNQNTKWRYQS